MFSTHWRCVSTSVCGTRHFREGLDCEDVCALAQLDGAGAAVGMVLSDGAGSACHARTGAALVARFWMEHFRKFLAEAPDPEAALRSVTRGDALELVGRIREAVIEEARARETEPVEFSATLLGAVLTPGHALIVQVGDGAWVGCRSGVLGCVTWPVGGEHAGQTVFANSAEAGEVLQVVHVPGGLTALAGFTDGLERLVLNLGGRFPVEGFFLPVFRALQDGARDFLGDLEAFLRSPRVCARTDDDKSLCLAVRADAVL